MSVNISLVFNNAGIHVFEENSDKAEAAMMDAVAAVLYAASKGEIQNAYGPAPIYESSAPQEVAKDTPAVGQSEKSADNDAKPVSRKTYYNTSNNVPGFVEKGDVLPEGAIAISKATYDDLIAAQDAKADDTDPGDGVDEEAQRAGEAEAEPEKEAEAEPESEAETVAVTKDDLRNKLMEFSQEFGAPKAKALVKKFGGAKLSEVPEDKYAEMYAEIEENLDL